MRQWAGDPEAAAGRAAAATAKQRLEARAASSGMADHPPMAVGVTGRPANRLNFERAERRLISTPGPFHTIIEGCMSRRSGRGSFPCSGRPSHAPLWRRGTAEASGMWCRSCPTSDACQPSNQGKIHLNFIGCSCQHQGFLFILTVSTPAQA